MMLSYPFCIAHLTFTALISAVNSQQDKTGVFNKPHTTDESQKYF